MKTSLILIFLACMLFPLSTLASQTCVAIKTNSPPEIDGLAADAAWQAAKTVTTRDQIADIPLEVQAVYTDEYLYMKVRFPDSSESREHKTLIWNSDLEAYRTGLKREDSFVLKWSMEPFPVDLSLNSEEPYRADVWYWKAFRTDSVGYADDKIHIYSLQKTGKSQPVTLPSGKRLYLDRPADSGKSTYMSIAHKEYLGDTIARYKHRPPRGSRADVRAKGNWAEGYWTVEFKRKLKTDQSDDLQFDPKLSYIFGVSRFEIAGKAPNPKLEQPYYESGDVSEQLTLVFR